MQPWLAGATFSVLSGQRVEQRRGGRLRQRHTGVLKAQKDQKDKGYKATVNAFLKLLSFVRTYDKGKLKEERFLLLSRFDHLGCGNHSSKSVSK